MPAMHAEDEDEAGVRVVGEMDSGVKAVPSSATVQAAAASGTMPESAGAEEPRAAGGMEDPVKRDRGILDRSKLSNISLLGNTSWKGETMP